MATLGVVSPKYDILNQDQDGNYSSKNYYFLIMFCLK